MLNATLDAANLTTGTLGNARIDSNLAWVNATNFFTGTNAFSGQTNFTGGATGANRVFFNNTSVHFLSDFVAINATLDASNLTTGALPVARISAGTIGNARLDSNMAFLNASQTFGFTNTFNGTSGIQYQGAPTAINISVDPRNVTNNSANQVIGQNVLPVFSNTSSSATGGLIVQFGNVTWLASNFVSGVVVTLAKGYGGVGSYNVIVTPEIRGNATGAEAISTTSFGVVYVSGTTFNITNYSAGAASPNVNLKWIAIGY